MPCSKCKCTDLRIRAIAADNTGGCRQHADLQSFRQGPRAIGTECSGYIIPMSAASSKLVHMCISDWYVYIYICVHVYIHTYTVHTTYMYTYTLPQERYAFEPRFGKAIFVCVYTCSLTLRMSACMRISIMCVLICVYTYTRTNETIHEHTST